MVDLHWAKLSAAATTKSKYRDEGINPDNPWSKMTPKADEPVQKRKRPTLKDAPPLTFPKLPRTRVQPTCSALGASLEHSGGRKYSRDVTFAPNPLQMC